jgi:threonine aldolase
VPGRVIDLRSDTVTRPTPEMRRAMAEAEVGDDVYGEDPTVNLLEAEAAALLGKPAGLFVPSGTMGNQIAVLCHTERGDEMLAHEESHVYYYEAGAPALLGGVSVRLLRGDRGRFGPEEVASALRGGNVHFPRARLLAVENTHNRGGGSVWEPERMRAVAAFARGAGLAVHLDGARLWNAAVALDRPPADLAAPADTVMCCLSKGLCAPVGSVICGPGDLTGRARRYRKALGGGMRQAGVLAAAGLVALRTMRARLAEDHANARFVAEALADVPGLEVDPGEVETNMVRVGTGGWPAARFSQALREIGVLANASAERTIRVVTHHDAPRADCERAVAAFRAVAAQPAR